MKSRYIVFGLGLIILIIFAFFSLRRRQTQTSENLVTPTPQTLSIQDKIEQNFKTQIPEDVDKAELKDVSGGNASGLATRKFVNSTFELAILADLPQPQSGNFYQGWIYKKDLTGSVADMISIGQLSLVKGGYMLDYKTTTDRSDYANIFVSLEVTFDQNPEKHILEGAFQ